LKENRKLLVIFAFSILIVPFIVFVLISGLKKEDKSITTTSTINNRPVDNFIKSQKYISPYTGEEISKEVYDNIPVMAIIENSNDARPQSGLNTADIVYETMAEGGIPRFIALFQKNNSSKIGPIRSARPYFIDISKEYNLPFAHCGGSEDALVKIKNENLMSLNEMSYSSTYWRDKERKAPHNLYTSTEKLRSLVKSKNYVTASNIKLNFDKKYWDNNSLPPANEVLLKINRFYNTSYSFKDGFYHKYMNNDPSVNKEDNEQLAFKNIVIQLTSIKLQNDASHLDIALVGEGNGYVISNGKYVKMKWFKTDVKSQTILQDETGKIIPLNPGNTWWNIVDTSTTVDIK